MAQKLTNVELMSEELVGVMEEKEREAKRAKTVRTEYLNDTEVLSTWMRGAELKVQDKTSDPHLIKESLQKMQSELPIMSERMERLTQNANLLCEKSNNEEEKETIRRNVDNLSEQFALIRSWMEEKKQQVGDCLDSWERFLAMYNTIMNWVKDKHDFLDKPLQLDNLTDAKQKQHDYSVAVKSSRTMGKTISDMSKELDHIGESGSIGDLSAKMEEAENAKAEVEAKLLERHSLLNEASEEWDQCEKKLREVRAWLDKCKGNLDSSASKKKPLRDQLASREKTMADITIQKTKIEVSIEKLRVHFRTTLRGADCVIELGETLKQELDSLLGLVRQQSSDLEATIAQVEQYQQETLQLKQEVVSSEQKLRMVSNPAYMPTDKDSAVLEQNALREKIKGLQSKITARTERIKLLLQRATPDLDPLT